jgi:hypothetical protein
MKRQRWQEVRAGVTQRQSEGDVLMGTEAGKLSLCPHESECTGLKR